MQRKCFQRKELIKTFVCLFIVLVSVAINNFQVSAQATDQPDFKLPLPPDKDWALSVETGTPSSFCGGEAGKYYGNPNTPDCYHAGNGRYSLDLLDNNRQDGDLSGRADVPILAPASGKVIKRVIDPGKRVGCACYGNYLIIDHGNGYTAIYGHLKDNSIDNIQEQQTVAAGEKIGIMGTSGDSSGIHLHFEIRYRGSGASQSAILDNLIIDGRKMIDYKVGTPTALLYYRSTNSQRYEGYLDNAKCDLIKGWAWDRTQSNIPVSVDIYDGDTKITSVVANESRPDITSYTRDNGLHGFSYPTPASLKDGKRHNIWVKISGPDHNLSFSPKTLHCGNVGNIEVASCSEVRGWAANTEQPNNIVNVSIYDGSTLITTIPANQPRPDVGAYLNDNGLHGFQYTFPSALATGAHSISVKISGANTEIDNSPKSITCGTPPPSTHYEGYLDQADCNLIKGWAVNRNSVNTPINVSIYDGNTLITTVLANQSRPDVGNYVGGNGLHGYSIPTPANLKDGQPHSISVKFEQSSTQLINSPKTINCGTTTQPPRYEGYLDLADCNVIRGWAADRSRLNTSINVNIYDGNTLITTVLANQSRSDLAAYLGDNGLHGFSVPTPANLKDGQSHSINIKFEQTSTQLSHSPKSITCGTPPPSTHYEGYLDQADCNLIKGWAVNRNSVNTPINVSIYDGNTLITTVLANQSRPDVGNYVGGNGLHGYSIPTPAGLKDGQPHSISVKFEQSSTQLINSPKTINCGSAPAPSITSIQPNQVVLNQATTLTVNGSNFQSGFSATVITPNGTFPINSAGLTFISANQVQVQVTLGGTLSYTATLRITNPGNQSADGTFQAVPPTTSAPTISSISPSEVTVNQTTTLTINGSNFQNGFAATVITINGSFPIASSGLTFVNSNQVKVQVAMGGSPPYNATLRITNPDGKSADGTFQVVRPAPSISSISPSTPFASTSNQDITVNGSNFLSGLTVDVTFPDGGGTTLSGTQIFDVTSSSFKMRIAPNSSGGWGIRVRNPDTKVSSVFNFTVRPQITSISPSSPPRSSTNQNITVNGSGFRSGLTVTITFPSGGSTTLSGTQIQNVSNNSFVMVAALNASGSWSIKVNNPNQSQSSNTFGFTVP